MSDLIIIHKSYQVGDELFIDSNLLTPHLLWKTCRRQILFSDENSFNRDHFTNECEIYTSLEAEEFLVQVLCGLKSPLIGETEVFGQFKTWWSNLPASLYKDKFESRIQNLFSVVKKIREESLCGMGSQSYGSLLRKKVEDLSKNKMLSIHENLKIDFIGAGQLVEEIIPWVQKKWSYRIWARDPQKVSGRKVLGEPVQILNLDQNELSSICLVVAAPLMHNELDQWLKLHNKHKNPIIFDFRHDSLGYQNTTFDQAMYFDLNSLSSEVLENKNAIERQVAEAHLSIENWKLTESRRAQVRPFGWDDL